MPFSVSEIVTMAQGVLPSVVAVGIGVFLNKSIANEIDGIVRDRFRIGMWALLHTHPNQPLHLQTPHPQSYSAQTIRRLATYVTFPCLVLRTFLLPAPLAPSSIAAIVGIYTLSVFIPAILTWASTKYMHPKERGVLAGLSLGSSVDLFALPVIVAAASSMKALHGPAAEAMIYTGCLVALLNVLTTHLLAPLYFSTAGPAFPRNFKHTDGGTYNGEWKGALKDGFGVYTYPSGATYEGEWLDGTKEGRGVYRFAKGGIYEGEWRNGKMEGVGVRTYSSGKVVSGLWEQGKLAKPIDESQCALVVANANEAALCAKKVFVGGIDGGDVVRGLLTQPGLIVGVAALVLSVGAGMGVMAPPQLSHGVDMVTMELAKAHGVLSLLGFGMMMDQTPVERRQRIQPEPGDVTMHSRAMLYRMAG